MPCLYYTECDAVVGTEPSGKRLGGIGAVSAWVYAIDARDYAADRSVQVKVNGVIARARLAERVSCRLGLERYPVHFAVECFRIVVVAHMLIPHVFCVDARLSVEVFVGVGVEPDGGEAIVC